MTELTYRQLVADARADDRQLVEVERPSADRAVVRMADPDKLNVLSAAMMIQLREALDEVIADPEVRAVVLTGAGPGFCTGGDLRLMRDAIEQIRAEDDEHGSATPWRFIRYQFGATVRSIAGSDTAFIAAVNGPAAGVGLAFAFACDLIVMSEEAVLVPAFGRLGLLPEVGTSWLVTNRLGYQRAFEYYVTGDHLDAGRALQLGVVNAVAPAGELLRRADEWCDRIAALPDHALRMGKRLLRTSADLTWEQALVVEEFAEPNVFTTGAFRRSVHELLEER